MAEPGGQNSWQDDVEARVREAIARALQGTAQQILGNGMAHQKEEAPSWGSEVPMPHDGVAGSAAAAPQEGGPGGPTREQMLEIIGRHMAERQEHFARDGTPLQSPEAVLRAMEADGFVIVGHRVALPAGYRGA